MSLKNRMVHGGGGRRSPARAAVILAVLAAFLGTAACMHQMSEVRTAPGTSPSPAVLWTPPPSAAAAPPPAPAPPVIPSDLLQAAQGWTLTDLVDLALRNNPGTRAAWGLARSAAADLGSKRGAYYPSVAVQASANKVKGSAVGGKFTFTSTYYNPYVNVNYLLFDFGGRAATVEEARQALIAADWTHNGAIQDVVLAVERAYYQYINARSLAQAEEAAVKEAQVSLDAAEQRRASGLSTIADVLQAKTVLSQAQLALETAQGQIQTIRGAVATAIGLPANTPFDVEIPVGDVPVQKGAEEVERLIQEAQERRPDLAAARALVLKAEAHARYLKTQDRPSFNTTLSGGRYFYEPGPIQQDTYSGTLLLTIPVFNGMTYQYNLFKAQADADVARAQRDAIEQLVIYQVWNSYYTLKTAGQRVETSRDLIESAQKSFEVISARYRAGVGSIIDLLTAESALESARAQQVQARTDWFLSLAQLAHDTGALWHPGEGDKKDAP